MIRVHGFLLATLLLLLSACSNGERKDQENTNIEDNAGYRRPNVILIMADDLGWGDTGYSGNHLAQTPNLDAMAKAGAIFHRFYAAGPVCSPTRGSVMTGRHPFRYGVYFANVGHLPEHEITLSELLQTAGYRTGFFGKWHLGTLTTEIKDANRGGRPEFVEHYSPPWKHGFDTIFASESKTPTYDPMIKPQYSNRETWWDPVENKEMAESYGTFYWGIRGKIVRQNLEGDDTRVIVDRVIPFIEDAAKSNLPFLAVVWPHTPHLPVVASAEDREKIASDDPFTAHYYGSVRAMDAQVGRIRDKVYELGIASNTLIWFHSDNGPEQKWPEHEKPAHEFSPMPGSTGGLRGAKRSLYEGGIRVPAIIEWPGRIPAGKKINAPTVTSDILPTILDYLALDIPENRPLDGISLKSFLEGGDDVRGDSIGFESGHQIAWIGDRYKLLHQPVYLDQGPDLQGRVAVLDLYSGQNPQQQQSFALYDLLADPAESKDISGSHPDVVRRLHEELFAWRQSVAESIVRLSGSPPPE